MELIPELKFTLFNGWILFLLLGLIQSFVLFIWSSRSERQRLLDRSDFTTKQVILTVITKLTAVVAILLICFTPLAYPRVEFFLGLILFALGMTGELIAIKSYLETPPDQPVTTGLYKYSRNPQEVMLTVAILGICISIGSGIALIVFLVSRVFNHFSIVAQEEQCLAQYGESYQQYLKRVPRYFIIF